jgi:hypothetical protein
MKKTLKNAIIAMLTICLSLSVVAIASAEDPNYEDINWSPEEPIRESEVSFTVDITGDNIEEVYVRVEECNDIFCYQDILNESMINTVGTTWEGSIMLQQVDTTYCTVWLEILSNGTWFDFKESKITFDVYEDTGNGDNGENGDNGGNGGNGENGTNDTPGFELIVLVISIIVAISIYKKKRIR